MALTKEYITFAVGSQTFAIDVNDVREIRGATPTTYLPHSPESVIGVINLRGAVVPIVDLAQKLSLPSSCDKGRNVILVVQIEERVLGLYVNEVIDIVIVEESSIQSISTDMAKSAQSMIRGVVIRDDCPVGVLDARALMPSVEEVA